MSFLTIQSYLSWSCPLGNEKGTKISTFPENLVFYVSQLKRSCLASFRGAQGLIYIVSWSLVRNPQRTVELRTGTEHPKKAMELLIEFAQLPGGQIKNPGSHGFKP